MTNSAAFRNSSDASPAQTVKAVRPIRENTVNVRRAANSRDALRGIRGNLTPGKV
ncbi:MULTISPECIES: hypothetical protein [unclassified Roseivivax]|uniref:hypothetical protein n=1 Tax=unclassified Roseivivax TaxID=2639302 RepID=UPI0015628955|nr:MULTISPECIES: hypothetical protein [unclassified Roseivivax]